MLDLEFVRPRFPALTTDWALLDNAGGSVPLGAVADAVGDYMRRCMVQVGASYDLSREAAQRVAAGHRAAEELLGANEGEVVLGPSSTALAKLIARALRPLWKQGDAVVVTDLDHEANIGPWRELEASGIEVREWHVDPGTHRLELVGLEPLLDDRTRLVAFSHCSNIVGTIHDVRSIAARVRAAGALTCVDGVAFAPHRRVDVKALGVDLYLASLYKVYGPHLSALYGRAELLQRARSQNHFFVPEDAVPYKLEPGNVTHELAASLPAVPAYLRELDRHHGGAGTLDGAFERIAEHEAGLAEPLLALLSAHPRTRLIGSPDADPAERAPTISFTVRDLASSAVPTLLDRDRVAVRYGHFYAHRLIDRLGLALDQGVVRASLVHYNSVDEVARLVDGLNRALA
ncbi:cysteine desulfurase-like protein [Engelhardtia mirabilis]|uniref:Putative cysteine desulfurase n=1 Tax=Engelhardtia mirabilis TaxID=2528011 RepID=A0A518BDS3_9BACT|nr:putative cysteine desulfurase [Planctomycetes bacterium Pla133]QDU99460.1 putative cysteine desulfurase [Planctomycetes bacterium Pla86]